MEPKYQIIPKLLSHRLAVLPIAAIVIFGFAGSSANNKSVGVFQYDPTTCRFGSIYSIYVTLYGEVFQIPTDHLHGIASLSPDEENCVPQALDPDEPLGCRDNPLPGSRFDISIPAPEGMVFQSPDDTEIRNPEDVIPVRRLAIRAVRPGFYGMQDSNIRAVERACENGEVQFLDDQIKECLFRPSNEDLFNRDQWNGGYITRNSIYNVPSGEPFVVDCILDWPVRNCSVSYKLLDTVNITYSIDIRRVDPTNFIDVDRAIRMTIENWHQPP